MLALITQLFVAAPGCSFATGCPWDELPFRCTTPALSVDYLGTPHYSGVVNCGNLFLEGDIGGGKNVAPMVTANGPGPRDTKYYALVMIDPDANIAPDTNGSFPDATAPGSAAPVRHWVVGNIFADDLANGDFQWATVISPFHGPSPPWGSHRYGLFLFAQPYADPMPYKTYNASAPITGWNYTNWIKAHKLGAPVASNWHVTMHTDWTE